jgi:hypothetical protein
LGHYGRPADIARAITFLAYAEAAFITGATWSSTATPTPDLGVTRQAGTARLQLKPLHGKEFP